MRSRGLDAISIKCVNGVTGVHGIQPRVNSRCWRTGDLSVICECDAYGLLTNVILSALTGQTRPSRRTTRYLDDAVLVGVCGYIPKRFCRRTDKDPQRTSGKPTVDQQRLEGKDGEGNLCAAVCKGRRVPDVPFCGRKRRQIPNGRNWAGRSRRPDFPSLLLKLEIPVQTYLENVSGAAYHYGLRRLGEELRTLCSSLNIAVDS